MRVLRLITVAIFLIAVSGSIAKAQTAITADLENGDDGVPVLLKNLPGSEASRSKTVWARSLGEIEAAIGPQPVLDLVELATGVEAVAAVYPEGKLLLIEYPTPQFSIEADQRFQSRLSELGESGIHYRRIGNYSAFVFEAKGAEDANGLLDEIKYSKTVRWLGEDPHYQLKVERYFGITTANVFISTLIAVSVALGIAIALGVVSGLIFYKYEERRRRFRTTFSDAGGMTRINLDGLSEDEN